MGAEVILVESRSRPRAPAAGSTLDSVTRASVDFVQTNKRAVTLDLKHPEGLSLLKELVQVSDVVIDNFSTGVMERLGLGYDTLRALRPDIVMLSMGAFGRTGPLRDARGFNSGVNLFSGVAAATGYPDGRPRLLGCFLPDTWAGFCAFLAILGALYHRKRTGQGQYIDYSMAEACLQLAPNIFIDFTLNEREPAFLGNRDPLRAPQGVYRCRGWDAWVAASVSTDGEWRRLCEALGRRDLADDSRFATSQGRRDHHDEIDSHIGRWAKLHTARQAAELLQGAGVTAGPVLNTKDVLNEPHLKARRTVAYVDHPEVGRKRLVAIPWRIGGLAPIRYRHAPDVGQDNDFVFQEVLGLTEPEMSHREKTGALS